VAQDNQRNFLIGKHTTRIAVSKGSCHLNFGVDPGADEQLLRKIADTLKRADTR
jgi:hypothetical protein